jgi:hypothetical protein
LEALRLYLNLIFAGRQIVSEIISFIAGRQSAFKACGGVFDGDRGPRQSSPILIGDRSPDAAVSRLSQSEMGQEES